MAVTVLSRLKASLKDTPVLPRDAATVQLALQYAALIDVLFIRLEEPEAVENPAQHRRVIMEIDTIGRRLDACLDRLGMSPGARPAARNAETGGDPASEALDGLRADADAPAGIDYSPAVDPAVTAALRSES